MGVGEDSPEVGLLVRLIDSLALQQTLLNVPPLLIALNDLSTPYIVRWHAHYPCDNCSINSYFFLWDHPPSYSATKNMARS